MSNKAFEIIQKLVDYHAFNALSMYNRNEIRGYLLELEKEIIAMDETVLKYKKALNEERKKNK